MSEHNFHVIYWEVLPNNVCRNVTVQGFANSREAEAVIAALHNTPNIKHEYAVFEGTHRGVHVHTAISVRINGPIHMELK